MLDKFLFDFSNRLAGKLNLRLESANKRHGTFRSTFIVSVTTRCNFHCPHCLREFVDGDKTLIKDLSPDIFEIVLWEGKKINFANISFTGGEPILNPRFEELVRLVKKYNYTYNFISNGWLFQDYWPIIEESRKNLDLVLLSIDGATAEVHDAVRNKPGSFERLIEAIRFFSKNKIPLMPTFCITGKNCHQIEEMADFCLKFGIKAIKWATAVGLKGAADILSEEERFQVFQRVLRLQEKFKNKIAFTITAGLVAGKSLENRFNSPNFCAILEGNQLYIDHDGALLPCCDLYQKCPSKPLIQELGFEKCLKINLDAVNELKKRHASDLLNDSLPKMPNFCDFCNNYIEECFQLARR